MKKLILFLLISTSSFGQVMTRNYDTQITNQPKAVVVGLSANLTFPSSGLVLTYNSGDLSIPLFIGRTTVWLVEDYITTTDIGLGYGRRRAFRKLHIHGQVLPKIGLGELNSFSTDLSFGVSREFSSHIVIRLDLGPRFFWGSQTDYDHPPDPITFMYPVEKTYRTVFCTFLSVGYSI